MSDSDEEMKLIKKEHKNHQNTIETVNKRQEYIGIVDKFYIETLSFVQNKELISIFLGYIDEMNVLDAFVECLLNKDAFLEKKIVFILENLCSEAEISLILNDDEFCKFKLP